MCRHLLPLLAALLCACSTTGIERGGRSDNDDTGTVADTAVGDTAGGDTTPADTTGGSGDTGEDSSADTSTQPGQPGDPCDQNGDCASGACLGSGGSDRRCAAPCTSADGCVAGWECLPLGGAGSFCQCTATTEACNGFDDDCDLLIDEGAAPDLGCTGLEQCSGGFCTCDGALLYCGSLCTDLNSDPANCGECGNACQAGFACTAGACSCDAPSTVCDGTCTDLDTDAANCGACGNACPDTLSCVEGLCACAPGQLACGERCVSADVDPNNCGGCGIVCGPTQNCTDGVCACPAGFGACGGECRNLATDPDNCGRCGNACAVGAACDAGSCACPGRQTDCDGTCTDTRIDEQNCGRCGSTCSGRETCTGGACSCPATATLCGADCTDTLTDANNCGGCGIVCAAGTGCEAGVCGCPCGGDTCDLGTCFILPPGAPAARATTTMLPQLRALDLAISIDVTGSMSTPIGAVQGALNASLGSAITALGLSATIGISSFADFPCSPYGGSGDIPFSLVQRQTNDYDSLAAAALGLRPQRGGDLPESGIEALYQIATGVGRATTSCSGATGSYGISPFNSATGLVPGVADGPLGGVGFRRGALPLIVHVTDALSSARGESAYPYGAAREEAAGSVRNLGGRIASIAIDTSFPPAPAAGLLPELQEFATQTEAVVPACAWDGARPPGCAAGQCCTGLNRTGVAATPTGPCPLAYRASAPTSSVTSAILLDAVERLQKNARFVTNLVTRRDEAEFTRSGIDTSCLVSLVIPNYVVTPGTCDPSEPQVSFSGDGYIGVHSGDELGFDIELDNNCIASTGSLRVYVVYFDLLGPNDTVLDTISLSVAVP
jgi:hypothetical protein